MVVIIKFRDTKYSEYLLKINLSGQLHRVVCPYLYDVCLCALRKKDGGLRPIAIGSIFRRLTAKLARCSIRVAMAEYLQLNQLGFRTRLGSEATIHATSAFIIDPGHSKLFGSASIELQNQIVYIDT